jgi:hypothetical protein
MNLPLLPGVEGDTYCTLLDPVLHRLGIARSTGSSRVGVSLMTEDLSLERNVVMFEEILKTLNR